MELFSSLTAYFREFWLVVGPGGKLHPAYFLEHKGHLVVEGLLLLVILYLFLQHSFKPKARAEDPLTDKVRSRSSSPSLRMREPGAAWGWARCSEGQYACACTLLLVNASLDGVSPTSGDRGPVSGVEAGAPGAQGRRG